MFFNDLKKTLFYNKMAYLNTNVLLALILFLDLIAEFSSPQINLIIKILSCVLVALNFVQTIFLLKMNSRFENILTFTEETYKNLCEKEEN